jgi:ribokinase
MSQVVVVGSCNIDYVLRVENLLREGETIIAKACHKYFGGKGANQAVAARKAGAAVKFVGKLGQDSDGDSYCEYLGASNISPKGLLKDVSARTGIAIVIVDNQGRNQIIVLPGANLHLYPEDIASLGPEIFQGKILLVQLEIPLSAVVSSLEKAKAAGMVTILNPAPGASLTPEVLKLVDIITPNQREASILSGFEVRDLESAKVAADKILKLGVKTVILTMGSHGALFIEGNGTEEYFPAFKVEVADTTAAGDAFNGALACAISEEKRLPEAVLFASAAAALATTREGAQPSLPTRREIDDFLREEGKND